MLAKLQLDHVLSPREPRLQIRAFKTIPKTLDSAYNEVMDRIEKSPRSGDKALALKILSWLYHAQRNLSMDELLDALSVDIDVYHDDSDHESDANSAGEDMDDLEENYTGENNMDLSHGKLNHNDIIECCKSLVIHESDGLVRFSHETVRLFVGKNLKAQLLPTTNLAKSCLTYLELPEFRRPCDSEESLKGRVGHFKFSTYAALYWHSHITEKAENSKDIQCRVLEALESQDKRDAKLQLESYCLSPLFYPGFPGAKSLLHVLASKGLARLCELILNANLGRNAYVS